ncbi:MAG: hypothetical protein HOQ45_02465 [Nocardioidaceae bacterium]|nr:hypothetical protein [Dermatophilaceae bacterium]NUR05858.1 hypothetical protein [Nocardioidaceae bacterium]NUR80024.1 hypothetical protein [Dermatophilaceae bacterium]
MTVAEAAKTGTERDLLEAMRDRIAEAITDPDCPKRELAALTLRLANIVKEIKALESAEGEDNIGKAMDTPDAKFDPDAI